MAISKLVALLNGLVQNVDLTVEELQVSSVRVGGATGTEITKTAYDGLVSNSHASGSDNQNVTAGDGLSGGGSGSTVNIAVDSSVLRSSQLGAANGVASLGADSKIPTSQIPDTVLGAVDYKGAWDADTNSPDLPAASPDKGDYYVVSVAGATSLGGITDWQIGDWAIYNGSAWEKVDNSDKVSSVNGATGTVVLDTDDISESGTPTNKWFTDARAKTAAVVNSTAGSETDQAASVSAMKSYVSSQVSSADDIIRSMVAGESFAQDVCFAVRMAVSGETAGRVYKCDITVASGAESHVIGLVMPGVAKVAGDSIDVYMLGEISSSVDFSASADEGKPVFIDASGNPTVTAPTTSGYGVAQVGMVSAVGAGVSKIMIQSPRLVYVA